MKNNIKIKLLTSIVILGILTTGVAYASMDVRTQLRNWYEDRINSTTTEIEDRANSHLQTAFINRLEKETDALIEKSSEELNNTKINVSFHAMSVITDAAKSRRDSIIAKKQELLGNLSSEGVIKQDFKGYSDNVKSKIDNYLQTTTSDVLESINESLDLTLSKMENEIAIHSQNDREELLNHIDASKTNLTSSIEIEKDETVTEITTYIDGQVDKHKLEITTLVGQNIGNQNSNVVDKSYAIENQAKEEMEEIINAIIIN